MEPNKFRNNSINSKRFKSSAMTTPTNAIANIATDTSLTDQIMHPSHVIEALNDDCLIEILLQKNIIIGDLLEVATTCKRLKEIATNVFHTKYKQNNNFDEMLKWSLEKIKRFLQFFGAHCETLDLLAFHKHNDRDEIAYFAAQYCKNVVNFRCYGWRNVDNNQLKKLGTKAAIVECFGSINAEILLEDNSTIQQLRFYSGSIVLPLKKFPELSYLKLNYAGVSEENLCEFFRLNPQLRKVEINDVVVSDSFYFDDGIEHLTNLEELKIQSGFLLLNLESYYCFENLKKLGKLRLMGEQDEVLEMLRVMKRGNVSLESIWIDFNRETTEDYDTDEFTDLICHFKEMKQLFFLDCTISGGHLSQLFNTLPQLKEIQCEIDTIDVDELERTLHNARQLRSATIGILYYHHLDDDSYYRGLRSIPTIARNNNINIKMLIQQKEVQAPSENYVIVKITTLENFTALAYDYYRCEESDDELRDSSMDIEYNFYTPNQFHRSYIFNEPPCDPNNDDLLSHEYVRVICKNFLSLYDEYYLKI